MEIMDHSVNRVSNVSKVVDPDLTWQSSKPVHLRNAGSSAAATHSAITEDSVPGIVPALVAAALFITFLLALYAVLWKCMDSKAQPQRCLSDMYRVSEVKECLECISTKRCEDPGTNEKPANQVPPCYFSEL